MKLSVTFLFLGLCLCSVLAKDEVKELLKDNTKGVERANELLSRIATIYEETNSNLVAQKEALQIVTLVQELLARLEGVLVEKTDLMVATLFNISKQGEEYAKRSESELLELARAQQITVQLLRVLESKMDAYQKHVLHSARAIDKNIDGLTRLVTRTVLPQLNGLKCSFDRLETSQINVEVELKSLAGIKELSVDSNRKLDGLERQLKALNRTQEVRIAGLTDAVNHLQPLNSWKVEGALRELIISQKRIELDLEECSQHSHSHGPSYGGEAPELHYSHPQPHPHPQPQPQPKPKRVDLVHEWSVAKGPQKQGDYPETVRVSAYAQSPEPKKPLSHSSHTSSSWRESLPWDTASQYQSAPAPYQQPWKPAPAYSTPTTPKSKPQSYKPQPHPAPSHNPQSYQEPTFKPQPVQPGDSYRIWYEDGALPQGY